MSVEANKQMTRRVFDEAFNRGDLGVLDGAIADGAVDHQHPDEPSFRAHLRLVITAMRAAFPDLHFEITQVIGEDNWVATHSIMTGTNTGELRRPLLSPEGPEVIPPTGRAVRVAHMHLLQYGEAGNTNLFHIMDTFALLGQLGLMPAPARASR